MNINVNTVRCNGKMIRTWDNPLNTWVRCLDTGKMFRRDVR